MTDPVAQAEARFAGLRIEAVIAIVVNAAIIVGFVLIVFGWHPTATRQLVLNLVPQTLGITVLGGVLTIIRRRQIASGGIVPVAKPTRTLPDLLIRIGGVALLVLAVVALPIRLLADGLAQDIVAPLPALLAKAIYGGLVGCIVTLPILRMACGMPFWPYPARDARIGARP